MAARDGRTCARGAMDGGTSASCCSTVRGGSFCIPVLVLMAVGAAVGIPLLAGPVHVTSRVALDVHTLLFAFAAIVLGFQCVAFAVCARVYALQEGCFRANRCSSGGCSGSRSKADC